MTVLVWMVGSFFTVGGFLFLVISGFFLYCSCCDLRERQMNPSQIEYDPPDVVKPKNDVILSMAGALIGIAFCAGGVLSIYSYYFWS